MKATSPPTSQASLFTPLWLACLLMVSVLMTAHGTNNFTTTGALVPARDFHTATLLHSGKVLVAGGADTFGDLTSTSLYDPATGLWSIGVSLATARSRHTATLLPNGKVLITGGYSNGITLASAQLYDPTSGTWSATGNLVAGRYLHTATLLASGKVLVAGGYNNGPLASAEVYDPVTGAWSVVGSLNTPRYSHTATLLPNGKVLVVGGFAFGAIASAELYDPVTGAWTAAGTLANARQLHTATLLPNGKVYVVGGYGTNYLTSAELYDLASGTWIPTGPLNESRYYHTATLLPNGGVLIAAGYNGNTLASAELYDPISGTATTVGVGSLATARQIHTATLLPSGNVLIAGGTDNAGVVASAELFDPAAPSWRATGFLTTPRVEYTATLLRNGKVLVSGGNYTDVNGIPHLNGSAEIYDPATGAWILTTPLLMPRYRHTATLLANGKVLVAAGYFFGPDYITHILASTELYDPVSGSWSATGNLATGRTDHTATLLPNGKVLVAGGLSTVSGGTVPSTASAELYDPATGSWTPTGSLVTPRRQHTATLLPNGKVLVAGGVSSNAISAATILASAELYDPVTGGWTSTGALATARYIHTSTLLPSGKVMVVAGSTAGPPAGSELYNPATGTWSPTGPTTSRRRHTATLLPNGKVLIIGGTGSEIDPGPGNAELYDPASGITTATAYPRYARDSHTTTLLPNGKVLIAGGHWYYDLDTSIFYEHDSAELYDVGLEFSAVWQPQIASASFDAAGRLILIGTGFRGIASASGGNGMQDSPTSYPVVQWRRLESEQSSFLLSDPATPVSATRFTSVPVVANLMPGHASVRVFANGIPSAAFPVLIGFPSIAVELPNGTVIPDGGTHNFTSVLGTPTNLIFTIRNIGSVNLTGLGVTKDGSNAADFTLTSSPTTPLLPSGSTRFAMQFASTSTGMKTAALHIANNVPGVNPYDINLTGQALSLSFTQDTDGDGLNDAAEVQLSSLGFDWQLNQSALVNSLFPNLNGALSNLNAAGYFTTAQVQALNVGVPLLQRNPTTGTFKLTIGVQKTMSLLLPFADFPMNAAGSSTIINGQGKLEFEFTVPDNAAFFRLESE